MIKACIFDLGGTIIDKYSITPLISLQRSFSKKNIQIKTQLIRKDMGLDKMDHIRQLCNENNVQKQWYSKYNSFITEDEKYDIFNDFKIIMKQETKNMELIPHTRSCIYDLKKMGIKMGVTTGFDKEQVDLIHNKHFQY